MGVLESMFPHLFPAFSDPKGGDFRKIGGGGLSNQKIWVQGLPLWHSHLESACQCREHGFEPWSGKIPHAVEQLSPCTTSTESACHNY